MGNFNSRGIYKLKAVILCAGFGKRLNPITNIIPKPLIPVLNIQLLEYSLYLLNYFKIKEVFINVFHLSDSFYKINNYSNLKLKIIKEPFIKGTLGGVLNFKEDLKNEEDFLVINGDILFYFDLNKLIKEHYSKKNIASMVLKENTSKHSPVFVDDFNRVVSIGSSLNQKHKEYMFTGVQVISKDFFKQVAETNTSSCLVKDFYIPNLNQNNYLSSYIISPQEFWYELGNLEQYDTCNLGILKKLYEENNFFYDTFIRDILFYQYGIKEDLSGIMRHSNTIVDRDVLIKAPVFFSKNVKIEKNCTLGPNVIVDENIVIQANSVLENKYIKKTY